MSIEEKAKAYDEALNKARKVYEGYKQQLDAIEDKKSNAALLLTGSITALECQFPELKESEDERMWKLLKKYVHCNISDMVLEYDHITREELESWLEKQKPVTEEETPHEPKFKVDDFIVNDYGMVMRITGIKNDKYEFIFEDKLQSWPIDSTDRNCHLWTVQDAKDGDVLATEKGWTCIFKSLEGVNFSSYCFMDSIKWFCEVGSECHTLEDAFIEVYNGNLYPATQQQKEALFNAMKEAGYEWDAEKKELKKIEQKPVTIPKFRIGDKVKKGHLTFTIEDIDNDSYKMVAYDKNGHKGCTEFVAIGYEDKYGLVEQKPAEWSEEDKGILLSVKCVIDNVWHQKGLDDYSEKELEEMWYWLDTIWQKVEYSEEWSEEDEKLLEDAIHVVKTRDNAYGQETSKTQDWLKSLRPQKQWKPSEEQMDGSTFSQGEITGMLVDFPKRILRSLLNGNAAKIPGLGTFKLKVSGKARENIDDVTLAVHPSESFRAGGPDLSSEYRAIGQKIYDWLLDVVTEAHSDELIITNFDIDITATCKGRAME